MVIKAVVFDLDGTIVSFNLNYKSARAEVRQFLTTKGYPQSLFSLDESIFEMLKKLEIYVKNNERNPEDFKKLRKAVLAILERYEVEGSSSTRLLPGILETLKTLKRMRLKLALFTVSGKRTTDYMVRTFHLARFFDTIVTRDSVSTVKPNPLQLQTVLKRLKINPQQAMVVGDSIWDMRSARELGALAVGVLTGVSSAEELIRSGANWLATSSADVPLLIRQLNQDRAERDLSHIA